MVEEGKTLQQILHLVQPDPVLLQHAHIFDGDRLISRDLWEDYIPKINSNITIRVVPTGGGDDGNKGLRIVLALVILVVSLGTAWWIGGAFGAFVGGTVGIGGSLLVNALVPPAEPKIDDKGEDQSRSLSLIEGARNDVRPFGVIPSVLGSVRMVPPFAAKPFTEFLGSTQFLRLLWCWGYGELQVEDLKIGETLIDDFADADDLEEIDGPLTYPGTLTDPPLEIYTQTVFEEDLNEPLTNVDGTEDWARDGVIRTSQPNADEISLDIFFPGLVRLQTDGDIKLVKVELQAQFRVTGSSDTWEVTTAGSPFASRTKDLGSAPAPFRKIFGRKTVLATSYRTDVLLLNSKTGTLRVREGDRTQILSLAKPPKFNRLNWLQLATIDRDSVTQNAVIDAHITDTRKDDYPFDDNDPETVWSGTDFNVTAGATDKTLEIAAGTLYSEFLVAEEKTSSGVIKNFSFKFDAPGQFDVRVRRVTIDSTGANKIDKAFWRKLRTIRNVPPINKKGLALTEMKIKVTEKLDGILDSLSGLVTTIAKDWNGSVWVERATNNPASLIRHVLQGPANARALPDSRLNLIDLQDFHLHCETKGYSFNMVRDFPSDIRSTLRDIAAAGRGTPNLKDGKWGVVFDKVQTIPTQHFSPRNTFNFNGDILYPDLPHGFKIRFFNASKGYRQDSMIVYRDTFDVNNSSKFEELELPGVTDEEQIFILGRYHIAVAERRREEYSFNADIEHLVCTRGDLVKFTNDVPLFGITSGRVKVVQDDGTDATGVTVDEPLSMAAGGNYSLRFRKADGTTLVRVLVTNAGLQTTVVFTTKILIANGPQVGDLFMFGTTGKESVDLLVKNIIPLSELNAKLTCVDYAPEVFDADLSPLPPFNSQITISPGFEVPFIIDVRSDEFVLLRNSDGTLNSRILITLGAVSAVTNTVEAVQCQFRITGNNQFLFCPEHPPGVREISIIPVQDKETYDFRLRYKYKDGTFGEWTDTVSHTIIGKSNPPADVQDFRKVIGTDSVTLRWDTNTDPDIKEYEIRDGSSWGAGVLVDKVDGTSLVVPVFTGTKTFQIKAIDTSGNESTNAVSTSITVTVPDLPLLLQFYDGPDFVFTWTSNKGTFVIDHWEVRKGGTDWASATVVNSQVFTARFQERLTFTGEVTYRFRAIDKAGLESATASFAVLPALPTTDPAINSLVIDNQVFLDWAISGAGSLPVDYWEIAKGAVQSTAVTIGTFAATAALILEKVAGTFTYWVIPFDTAGNEGVGWSIALMVDDPPDFEFKNQFKPDFASGVNVNVFRVNPNQLHFEQGAYGPKIVGPQRTFQQHFDDKSWADPQAQVTDGYNVWSQDGTASTTGSYEEEFDAGVVIVSAKITLATEEVDLNGGVTWTPTISWKKLSGDSWTDGASGATTVFASDFQFIKIDYALAVDTDNKDYGRIIDFSVAVKVKTISDQGSYTHSANPSTVTLSTTFVSISSITASVEHASLARFAVIERVDVTSFKVRVFDDAGTAQTGDTVNWIVRGV